MLSWSCSCITPLYCYLHFFLPYLAPDTFRVEHPSNAIREQGLKLRRLLRAVRYPRAVRQQRPVKEFLQLL